MADYTLVEKYLGFNRREDQTNLAPGTLVKGSKNVLSRPGNRFGKREGMTLDGQSSTANTGIKTSFDWETSKGYFKNMRVGNGKMQYRYVATAGDRYLTNTLTAGQVYWIDLISGITQEDFSFTTFWDTGELLTRSLFVNRNPQIQSWFGGVTTVASVAAATITKIGTTTWAAEGFAITSGSTVVINGTTYTYTGGAGTTTLTGVTPSPVAEPVQSVVHQGVVTTLNSAMTGIAAAFKNTNISILNNQIYMSAYDQNDVYILKQNFFGVWSFSSPRLPYEGAYLTLDSKNALFIPQEDVMYVSCGTDDFYQITFKNDVSSTGAPFQTVDPKKLKTSPRGAVHNRDAMFKGKNEVYYINNEPALDTLGRVVNILGTPQNKNISDIIRDDFDEYDFTNASGIYYRYNIYLALPAESLVLIFNVDKGYWEPPQTMPISRFAIIDGLLYGHGSATPQTFKLFSGRSDNGFAIDAQAYFSFDNFGSRSALKAFEYLYVEGYISGNTSLKVNVQYDIDGCATSATNTISGSDSQIVCLLSSDAGLGKVPLGKNPIGGTLSSATGLAPKFRAELPYNQVDFNEMQLVFSSNQLDEDWQIIAFGPNVALTGYGNPAVRK